MTDSFRIAVLPGDGVGPEVTAAAVQVLEAAGRAFSLRLKPEEHPIGWAAVQATGHPLPASTLAAGRPAGAGGGRAGGAPPPAPPPPTCLGGSSAS
jgi:3-isopropylmalate dehydrogenase